VSALLGGSVSSAIVLLAEELPARQRARGQASAAFASALGGVLGYLIVPFLLAWGYSWRWLLAPSSFGWLLAIPVARMLPNQAQWSRAKSRGSAKRTHIWDIFHPLYRRRALALLSCAALDTVAGTAVNGWLYFQAVSILGLSPIAASTLVVTGMGVGMLGFPIGAWTAEKIRASADRGVRWRRGVARRIRLLLGTWAGLVALRLAARFVLLVQDRERA